MLGISISVAWTRRLPTQPALSSHRGSTARLSEPAGDSALRCRGLSIPLYWGQQTAGQETDGEGKATGKEEVTARSEQEERSGERDGKEQIQL